MAGEGFIVYTIRNLPDWVGLMQNGWRERGRGQCVYDVQGHTRDSTWLGWPPATWLGVKGSMCINLTRLDSWFLAGVYVVGWPFVAWLVQGGQCVSTWLGWTPNTWLVSTWLGWPPAAWLARWGQCVYFCIFCRRDVTWLGWPPAAWLEQGGQCVQCAHCPPHSLFPGFLWSAWEWSVAALHKKCYINKS